MTMDEKDNQLIKELEELIHNLPEHIEYKIYRYRHEMVFSSVMEEMINNWMDNWECSPSEYFDSSDGGYDNDMWDSEMYEGFRYNTEDLI